MTGKLTIIRGLPGSGKSTLAKLLAAADPKGVHIESDQYHMVHGEYKFSKYNLADAHEDCLCRTLDALAEGKNVYCSNVFSQYKHFQQYPLPEQIITMSSIYDNIHEVPDEVMLGMKFGFQDINIEQLKQYKEAYSVTCV